MSGGHKEEAATARPEEEGVEVSEPTYGSESKGGEVSGVSERLSTTEDTVERPQVNQLLTGVERYLRRALDDPRTPHFAKSNLRAALPLLDELRRGFQFDVSVEHALKAVIDEQRAALAERQPGHIVTAKDQEGK